MRLQQSLMDREVTAIESNCEDRQTFFEQTKQIKGRMSTCLNEHLEAEFGLCLDNFHNRLR